MKNASFDYVPPDQLRSYSTSRYSAVPENYAVYVNSTSSPLPVIPVNEHKISPGNSTGSSSVNTVKTSSLATHV